MSPNNKVLSKTIKSFPSRPEARALETIKFFPTGALPDCPANVRQDITAFRPSTSSWTKAQKDITQLCDQVAAYYQLEQLYKDELAALDPGNRSAATILKDMRAQVAESGEFERPYMTSTAASKLRREWG